MSKKKPIAVKLNPNKIIESISYFVGPGGKKYDIKKTSTKAGSMGIEKKRRGGMSKQEYNDMVDKKIKSREESKERFKKAREDFDLRRKAKEKSTSESLEKQREEFFKKLEKKKSGGSISKETQEMIESFEKDRTPKFDPKMFDQPESEGGDKKPKAVRPKAQPNQKREGEKPIAKPGKKPIAKRLPDKPITSILEKESIEFIRKNKKSKGGLIKGFPRLAKKGF